MSEEPGVGFMGAIGEKSVYEIEEGQLQPGEEDKSLMPVELPELHLAGELQLVDLHTHTTASDGSMTPSQLVRHAKQMGLKALAVTDHDTLEGIGEALETGRMLDIEVVPGVEISVDFEPEMHILGYFINTDHTRISDTLEALRERRDERNPRIVRRLNELGVHITMEEVERYSSGTVTGRPHIAKAMIEKGYAASMPEAFDKYLASGRPAYFKKDKLTPEEGIAAITEAGGLPVLAHPVHLGMDADGLDKLLLRLSEAGLVGIEAYYVDNRDEKTTLLVKLAEKYSLVPTGGSDFHGSFKPDIELGIGRGNLRLPYSLLEGLKRRQKSKD